jgi:transcriptional regulator with XRE-family HTH domain
MKQAAFNIKPQDIVVLLKLVAINNENWNQKQLAEELKMSQSEISQSLQRLQYCGLLLSKQVMRLALVDFLQYAIAYVFAQKPGAIVRGISTAHSAGALNKTIISNEQYVWPYAKGNVRGQSIIPLYPSVPDAAQKDEKLYELLALVDAIRVGRVREKELAIEALRNKILNGK